MRAIVLPKLRALFSSRRGNVSLLATILAVPLLLAAGFAVDYGMAVNTRASLQNVLDAAVLAGAAMHTADGDARIARAQATFQSNKSGNTAPAAGAQFSFVDDVVSGTARTDQPFVFMKLVGLNSAPIEVTAAAAPIGQPLCLLALDPSANAAVAISGSRAGIQASNCGIQANSTSPTAITNTANTESTVDFICVVGGASGHFNVPPEKCEPVTDPYADLPVPPLSGCDAHYAKTASGSATYSPGVYCGGIDISGGQVVFKPGVYVVKEGLLDIGGNAIVTGKGVVFYFYGSGASLKLAGNDQSDLSAPTTGPYAGLLFVQNENADPGMSSQITGTSATRLVGAGYFPKQTLEIGGTAGFGTASNYMTFVADQYRLFGNGELQFNFDPKAAGYSSVRTAMHYTGARLIE